MSNFARGTLNSPSTTGTTQRVFSPPLSTFLQVSDPLVEGSERGLHSAALLRLVAQPWLPLLDAVDAGQHLLLQVVDLTLEEVFETVRLHGVVAPAELLSGRRGKGHLDQCSASLSLPPLPGCRL